ncbi:MAG: tRNA pseudouridine(55) synthase TruB [Clostridia bacterium]
MEINGIINLYKEKGMSSFSAVNQVRKIIGLKKAGHTGTLDPMAEGVLLICLGKATRASGHIMSTQKEYRARMLLGVSTDTYDLQGELLGISPASGISEPDIRECIHTFIGRQMQYPPIYSAKKVKGKKLYDYALKDQSVEIQQNEIDIQSILVMGIRDELLEGIPVKAIDFTVQCSKGTYIRSLCHDIGEKLGSHGTLAELIRTRNGMFSSEDSCSIKDIEKAVADDTLDKMVIPVEDALEMDRIVLDRDDSLRYERGLSVCRVKELPDRSYLVFNQDTALLGIGCLDAQGFLRSKRRLG